MADEKQNKGQGFLREKEEDDFWDLEHLLAGKRQSFSPSPSPPIPMVSPQAVSPHPPQSPPESTKSSDTKEIAFSSEGRRDGNRSVQKAATSAMPEGTTVCVYEGDGLLQRVKISRWPSKYSFYEQFLRYARDFFDVCYGECDYVPFFSFMPQYQQMSRSQLHYYMWWRENLRKGICLQSDQCYILLLVYEIINLPDRLPPSEGARLLAFLWASYRDRFPKLDRYLAEWLPDYCLIHRQPCPSDLLAPFLAQILPYTTLKEFYLGGGGKEEKACLSAAMLELSVGYRFRRSKYFTPETEEVFCRHIPAAMEEFLSKMSAADERFAVRTGGEVTTSVRDSYVGAVCALRFKRRIEVTYLPAKGEKALSDILTDAVKYCENAVRASLGIRSRFRITHLTPAMSEILEDYFRRELPEARLSRSAAASSAAQTVDDSAYEPLHRGFSLEEARAIEQSSRQAARLLSDVYADEPFSKEENSYRPETWDSAVVVIPEETTHRNPLPKEKQPVSLEQKENETLKRALLFLYTGDTEGFRALAQRRNCLTETLAQEINEAALERLGDIAAEERDGCYRLIEDYREDVKVWIDSL